MAMENISSSMSSIWDMIIYLISNVPWWIIKFIDWLYTLITAFIIRLISR